MKKLLIGLILSASVSSYGVEFSTKETSGLIEFNIVASELVSRSENLYGYDDRGFKRLSFYSHAKERFTYSNSAGAEVARIELDSDSLKRFYLIISRANDCAVQVKIKRTDFELVSVSSQCDEFQ